MAKTAKIIRIITVAPIAAAIITAIIFFGTEGGFKNLTHYIMSLVFLTVLPLIAYPISLAWKKDVRRNYQRALAIDLSVVGYIGGMIFAFATSAPLCEKVLYMTYLISGAAIAICSFVFKKKSSGHACGIAGPVALLSFFVSPFYSIGVLLLIPVFWSSLKMKRHSFSQLLSGSVIPVVALMFSILVLH